ncbi:MAG: hypothetical protein JW969_14320 [Spirochaetales bacterium]|nr:hypothetical protein [Spirochaetales bacterium]
MNIKNAVDKAYETMSLRDILKSPVSAIQGVSAMAAKRLKEAFRISTVEQFAKLRFAKWAWSLVSMEKYSRKEKADTTTLNINKAVDKAYEDKTIKEILDAPVSALQGLSERQAELLAKALRVRTVRKLGTSKAFHKAMAIYFMALSEDTNSDPNSQL